MPNINPPYTLRQATEHDCPRLLELIKELAIYEQAPNEVTVTLQHFAQSGFGTTPVWWAYVVCNGDGYILGFALYYIRYSTWKGQRMYLEDIIVTEQARGQGIGAMLMNKLMAVANQHQFSGMLWQVLEWNTSAIEFYKKYKTNFDSEWINCSIEFA